MLKEKLKKEKEWLKENQLNNIEISKRIQTMKIMIIISIQYLIKH